MRATPSADAMTPYIVTISGLAQPPHLSNGMAALALELRKADVNVYERKWDARDFAELTEELAAKSAAGGQIYLAGHSYGGWRAALIADKLCYRGVPVAGLFLCDAVEHRRPKRGTIIVPTNVERVWIWRQQTSPAIRGSTITCDSPSTVIEKNELVPGVGHHEIDSLPDFHKTVLSVLTKEPPDA